MPTLGELLSLRDAHPHLHAFDGAIEQARLNCLGAELSDLYSGLNKEGVDLKLAKYHEFIKAFPSLRGQALNVLMLHTHSLRAITQLIVSEPPLLIGDIPSFLVQVTRSPHERPEQVNIMEAIAKHWQKEIQQLTLCARIEAERIPGSFSEIEWSPAMALPLLRAGMKQPGVEELTGIFRRIPRTHYVNHDCWGSTFCEPCAQEFSLWIEGLFALGYNLEATDSKGRTLTAILVENLVSAHDKDRIGGALPLLLAMLRVGVKLETANPEDITDMDMAALERLAEAAAIGYERSQPKQLATVTPTAPLTTNLNLA